MLILNEFAHPGDTATATVTLPFDKRVKGRVRVILNDQRDAGIHLPRGQVLRSGDKLKSACGEVVEVQAAVETVSQVNCNDPLLFARACYHLGNRHVQLQIEHQSLRYLHDHVLDEMLSLLGLQVRVAELTFNPEPGAYGGGHTHSHDHEHDHEHEHEHEHEHDAGHHLSHHHDHAH